MLFVIVNKWDLLQANDNNQTVTNDELDTFCKDNNYFNGWFDVSVKSGLNISNRINFLIREIANRKCQIDYSITNIDTVNAKACVIL